MAQQLPLDPVGEMLKRMKEHGQTFVGPVLQQVLKVDKTTSFFPLIIEVNKETFFKTNAMSLAREMPMESKPTAYQHFPFVQGMVSRDDIKKVLEHPEVLGVFLDRKLKNMVFAMERDRRRLGELNITRVKKVTLGQTLTTMGVKHMHEVGIDGRGVTITVLDTGTNPEHPMIRPNLIHMESVNPDERDPIAHNPHGPWCQSASGGAYVNSDEYGEMFGAAPRANLISIKVLDKSGGGAISTIIRGMDRAIDLGSDVISMSLGAALSFGDKTPDSRAVDLLNSHYGIPAVVAAGNSGGVMTIASPGDSRYGLTIGSIGYSQPWRYSPSMFSSKGPTADNRIKPDFTAFGGDIYGNVLELIMGASDNGSEYEGEAGTSMATPQVAGVVALLKQMAPNNELVGVKPILEDTLKPTAYRPLPSPFKDVFEGWGIPNPSKLLS